MKNRVFVTFLFLFVTSILTAQNRFNIEKVSGEYIYVELGDEINEDPDFSMFKYLVDLALHYDLEPSYLIMDYIDEEFATTYSIYDNKDQLIVELKVVDGYIDSE